MSDREMSHREGDQKFQSDRDRSWKNFIEKVAIETFLEPLGSIVEQQKASVDAAERAARNSFRATRALVVATVALVVVGVLQGVVLWFR